MTKYIIAALIGALLVIPVLVALIFYLWPKKWPESEDLKPFRLQEPARGFLRYDYAVVIEGVTYDLKEGTIVYRSSIQSAGAIDPNCIAVTALPNKPPFFEVPRDAVEWEDPLVEALT